MMEHQNNGDPGNRNNAASSVSLGAMLREAREHLNLSVAEVAGQIKFAPRQIEALESDDFKHLPETAFLRGFVRSYAKILNLDVQPLLALLPQEKAAVAELIPASVDVPYPVGNTSQRQNLILLGAALLLAVIAVGFSVWHFTNPLRRSTVAKIESPLPLPAEKQASPERAVEKHSVTDPSHPAGTKQETSAIVVQSSVKPDKTRNEISDLASATAAQSSGRAAKPKATSAATVTQSPVQAANTKIDVSATAAQSSVQAAKTRTSASSLSPATVAQPSVSSVKAKAAQTETQDQTQNQANGSGSTADTGTSNTVLKLVFDEESWAEIKDKDGNMISSQINPRGSELNVKGQLPLSLVIGHAATTHLFKNGQAVDMTPYINSSSEVARFTLE